MKTPSITIRLAVEFDAEQLQKLNCEFNGPELTSVDEIQESIKTSNEVIAVALMNEVYVGFICAQYFKSFCYCNFQGEITELYVREAYRGRGIAAKLISFVEKELHNRGVRDIKVLTGGDNHEAIKTYSRSQYVKDDDLVFYKTSW